jgi:hypothetical protein
MIQNIWKALHQYFGIKSDIECEKHKWVKISSGRWCENCGTITTQTSNRNFDGVINS